MSIAHNMASQRVAVRNENASFPRKHVRFHLIICVQHVSLCAVDFSPNLEIESVCRAEKHRKEDIDGE